MTEETAVPAEADAEATNAGEDRSTASGTAIAQPDNLPEGSGTPPEWCDG